MNESINTGSHGLVVMLIIFVFRARACRLLRYDTTEMQFHSSEDDYRKERIEPKGNGRNAALDPAQIRSRAVYFFLSKRAKVYGLMGAL